MKTVKLSIILIAFAVTSWIPAQGQKTNFNGTWKLDYTKSSLPEYTPLLTKITVQIKGDSLLTERVYDTGDGQGYPFKENIKLDGKDFPITIYDMPRKTKGSWSEQDGTLNIESVTTFSGDAGTEDFISKEVWKVDQGNKSLTISFNNKISAGEADGTFVFTKAE